MGPSVSARVVFLPKVHIILLQPANEVWGKVILLHLFVILFTGGSTWAGTPPGRYTPQAGTHPLGRYTPRQVHPPEQVHPPRAGTPPGQVHPPGPGTAPGPGTPLGAGSPPPGLGTPPGSSACWEIRATSERYASYWNAFL